MIFCCLFIQRNTRWINYCVVQCIYTYFLFIIENELKRMLFLFLSRTIFYVGFFLSDLNFLFKNKLNKKFMSIINHEKEFLNIFFDRLNDEEFI